MKLNLYNQIVQDIKEFQGLTRDCAEILIKKYPYVPAESLHSILSIDVMNRLKTNRCRFNERQSFFQTLFKNSKWKQPAGIIVRLSASINVPPSLVARSILQSHYKSSGANASNGSILQYLKDSTLIDDPNLAYEIYLSALYDDRNGFISNAFARAIGEEYEVKLQEYLQERKMAFSTENDLRDRGYDKTPDIKLEIPIAVDGFVINWIESKARFGSPCIHKANVKSQLLSYWNRFGPGLIIYWFDFVDEIVEPNEKKFLVMNDFPENITYMKLNEL